MSTLPRIKSPELLLAATTVALAVAATVMFSTCQNSKSKPTSPSASSDAIGISGVWSTDCLADPGKSAAWYIDTREFDGETFRTRFASYTDAECSQPAITQSQSGTWESGTVVGDSGAIEINITIDTIAITPHTDGIANNYNNSGFCGGGWESGVEKPVTRADCAATADKDDETAGQKDMIYDIVSISDGSMRFGKKDGVSNGKTPETRPMTLDNSKLFRKQ